MPRRRRRPGPRQRRLALPRHPRARQGALREPRVRRQAGRLPRLVPWRRPPVPLRGHLPKGGSPPLRLARQNREPPKVATAKPADELEGAKLRASTNRLAPHRWLGDNCELNPEPAASPPRPIPAFLLSGISPYRLYLFAGFAVN